MRVALYARVSTEEQAVHGLSIEAQLAALREAYPNGIEYVDLGISARKPISKRPELQRLLRDVEQNKIDLVCFCKLDRWTRNIREYYKAQDILDAHNVPWKALHEDYETQTAAGRLKVNIMLAVAQDEADRTSERIKAVFEDKRRRGIVPTASVPLGVQIVNGKYAPSEDAQKVQDIFEYFISTRSTTMTAKRYGYTGTGLRKMIRNKTYLSTGIIDLSTFDLANEIVNARSQRHVRSDRVYLFSGLLVCPDCGSRMGGLTTYGYVYYRCSRHADGLCRRKNVRETEVEQHLLSKLLPAVDDLNLTIKQKQKKSVNLSDIKKKQDKLTDLYLNDLITKEKYAEEFKALQSKVEEAEKEPKPIDKAEIKTVLQAYEGLSRQAKKAFWSNVVTRITPTENGYDFTLFYT